MNVLSDVKKVIGIPMEHDHFDTDILIHINTVVNILRQVGAFQNENYIDKLSTWGEIIEGVPNAEMIKTYICLRVRMMFDPPSGAVKEVLQKTIDELEWRINVQSDR